MTTQDRSLFLLVLFIMLYFGVYLMLIWKLCTEAYRRIRIHQVIMCYWLLDFHRESGCTLACRKKHPAWLWLHAKLDIERPLWTLWVQEHHRQLCAHASDGCRQVWLCSNYIRRTAASAIDWCMPIALTYASMHEHGQDTLVLDIAHTYSISWQELVRKEGSLGQLTAQLLQARKQHTDIQWLTFQQHVTSILTHVFALTDCFWHAL